MNFQDIISTLNRFWADQGCLILQPYDTEKGAGTMSPHTVLRAIGPEPWAVAYPEPCRRPTDGRYGDNPNRAQHYFQYQVLIKPSPDGIQETYLASLEALGIRLLHPLPMTLGQSEHSDGGFAVADYRAIEPALGSLDDVRALAADLHERGMALAAGLPAGLVLPSRTADEEHDGGDGGVRQTIGIGQCRCREQQRLDQQDQWLAMREAAEHDQAAGRGTHNEQHDQRQRDPVRNLHRRQIMQTRDDHQHGQDAQQDKGKLGHVATLRRNLLRPGFHAPLCSGQGKGRNVSVPASAS